MVSARNASVRIVFFGTPEFAVPSLQRLALSSHRLAGVVTQPDRPRGRGQRVSASAIACLARGLNVPVLQPERLKAPAFREAFARLDAELAVVAAYGRMLPGDLLESVPRGFINVHASLLPRYRGAAPIHRAILAGETQTGVTIMRVVQELDAGPILAHRRYPIGPDETSDEVERALAALGAALLVEIVDAMARGPVVEQPQDHSQATYAPRLTKEDGVIDWSRAARDIHNQVRGLHPWPHAFSSLQGRRLVVVRTAVGPLVAAAPPGSIVEADADRLRVATGAGTSIDLVLVQLEGRRAMSAREFLAGHRIAAGARFDVRPQGPAGTGTA